MPDAIPVLDVQGLREDTNLAAIGSALHGAFKDWGFAYIANHGVPGELQRELAATSRRFFAEPLDVKMAIAMKHAGLAWRGYFPVGGELTASKPDQKEGLYFGAEHQPNDPGVMGGWPMHGKNLWPAGEAYKDFAPTVLRYMAELTQLGHALMKAVGVGLGLTPTYFRERFTDRPTMLFRCFNYPARPAHDQLWGVGEHTDMGFLTILLQDNLGGLEVKSQRGTWIKAPPIPDTFIINIGDMLQHWTHGIYRATLHRVKNIAGTDRVSFPFFFDPNWQCPLLPIDPALLPKGELAEAKRRGNDSRWDGLDLRTLSARQTYGDFVWEKIRHVFPDLAP